MFLQKQQVSCFLGCAALAVTLSAHPGWPQAGGDKKADPLAAQDDPNRELLRLAKLPTDGPGLLKLLDKLGGKDEDLLRLDQLIAQLGDLQFAKRTDAAKRIVALNQAAIAGLKTAQLSKDAEIASRAKDCLKDIYKSQKLGIPLTAVRVLARLKPDGLAEALLHFLPYTAEEEVQEEVWFTLYDLVKEAPRLLPLLEKALGDPLPARRAVAGCVLGRLGSKAQQTAVAKLLTDADPHVRLRSAQGLLAGKNLAGVPTLIQLLEHPAVEISWSAEELLHYLAGDDAPAEKVGAASDKERLASRKAWEAWWGKQGSNFSFADVDQDYRRPALYLAVSPETNPPQPGIDDDPALPDDLRVKRKEESKGQLALYGCDGKLRWHLRDWVNDAQLLPGNRLLVVGYCPPPGIPVSERNLHGKVLWNPKVDGLFLGEDPEQLLKDLGPSLVTSCRRLVDGNTFIAMLTAGGFEINRDGELVHRVKLPNKIVPGEDTSESYFCLRLLSNGRVLAGPYSPHNTALLEIDYETGKELRRVPLRHARSRPLVMSALAGGNYVIWQPNLADLTLQEIDSQGKPVGKPGHHRGIRLRNGNTLAVRDFSRMVEFSPDGRALWEAICQPFGNVLLAPERIHECLGLLTLGFDAPRPADLDVHSSLAYLKRRLRSKDQLERLFAAGDLGALGPKAKPAIPELSELFDDVAFSPFRLIEILKAIGPAAFPAILNAASHKRAEVRSSALWHLGGFPDQAKVAEPILLEALKDKDPDIRRSAISGLAGNLRGRLRGKDMVPEKERKYLVRRIAEMMSDADDKRIGDVRPVTEWACIHLRGLGPDAIPYLLQALKAKEVTMRTIAANGLGWNCPDPAVIVPELLEAFHAKDVQDKTAALNFRYSIIDAFRLMGPKAKSATPLLTQVLRDKSYDFTLRSSTVAALAAIGERTAAIEQALTETANDGDSESLRKAANDALNKLRKK